MSKTILGLDLGTNSIGWALLKEVNKKPASIIDLGCRIFPKAVEEKTPTPKNAKRRNARMARRILQRRARRKLRMIHYLIKLELLPHELRGHTQPEILLNQLGDPYQLRAKALDTRLEKHELGRVFLHLVQRRGFLSNRKTTLGDMIDDPDVMAVVAEMDEQEDNSTERAKEETAFKKEITELRNTIINGGYRTLGEYLASLDHHDCKRNRSREGGHLRTDRQMYRDELNLIWEKQSLFHNVLTDKVKEEIEEIIFYQRPLKLRSDRIGKCSLEPSRNRARMARLEYQRFRYLQDISHLAYFDVYSSQWKTLSQDEREKLVALFEQKARPTFKTDVRKALGFDKGTEFNLDTENKKLKGNITACEIRSVWPEWDTLAADRQHELVEDLLTIQKKSVLKNRLITHWEFAAEIAVKLCLLEFEPGHANLSLKAIKELLPYLEKGCIYSEARVAAGYGYEVEEIDIVEKLGPPPVIANPIVNKALHELRRLINALIKEYGKPDAIRIEMARDLEMNTKRYKAYKKQQAENTRANQSAEEHYLVIREKNPQLQLSKYPSRIDKIKYRLWKDQDERCAYSNKIIPLTTLFSSEIDIDHILPYSQSLDDSYMNKVVCFVGENRFKGQRTPIDAFGGNEEKWEQICQSISRWDSKLKSKRSRFFMSGDDLLQRDFINSQLNDTRYISKVALEYVKQLGADISVSKGITTAWVRHKWGLDSLLGDSNDKERTDHRHHIIDAVVIACVDRQFYKNLAGIAKDLERQQTGLAMRDLYIDTPWEGLRNDLDFSLKGSIVSHAPLRKLSGELHEDTGSGFMEGKGTVYRKGVSTYFDNCMTEKEAEKKIGTVIDPVIAEQIRKHLKSHQYNAKVAFAEDKTVLHKDGKTPIKRIRVYQSTQIKTRNKLEQEKFGKRNQDGKIFKWYSYGNIHHIEILRDKKNNKYIGQFVTMMEAHRRAMTGTKSALRRGVTKEPIIRRAYGDEYEFVMAMHKQDTVCLSIEGKKELFVVKSLGQLSQNTQPRPKLIHHTSSDGKINIIFDAIGNLMTKYDMKPYPINVIGKQSDDQTNNRY